MSGVVERINFVPRSLHTSYRQRLLLLLPSTSGLRRQHLAPRRPLRLPVSDSDSWTSPSPDDAPV